MSPAQPPPQMNTPMMNKSFPRSGTLQLVLGALGLGVLVAMAAGGGCSPRASSQADGGPRDAGPGSGGGGGAPLGGASASGGSIGGGTGAGTGASGGNGGANGDGGTGAAAGGAPAGGGGPAVGGGAGGRGGGGQGTGGVPGSAGAGVGGSTAGTFDIYWIDVEGGAATLLVSPSGQTMLVDGGFPGNADRDLNRILKVVNEQVRATKLDYVVTTHFHVDHVGGVTALATRFPVGQFMDHGPSIEGGADYNDYVAAVAGKTRVIVRPGDRLMLGELDILFVAAAGQLIAPLPTAIANPHCAGAPQMPERPTDENPQSVGFLARFGAFDFVDLGDMTWAVEDRMACPMNRIGPIDLFQVSHHGLNLSSPPQLVHGLAPLVAIINNGATKGGAATTFDTLKASPGIQDIWQLHRAVNNDAAHNTAEALIANITTSPDAAHFVKASVARDGSFTVSHTRTGEIRSYRSR